MLRPPDAPGCDGDWPAARVRRTPQPHGAGCTPSSYPLPAPGVLPLAEIPVPTGTRTPPRTSERGSDTASGRVRSPGAVHVNNFSCAAKRRVDDQDIRSTIRSTSIARAARVQPQVDGCMHAFSCTLAVLASQDPTHPACQFDGNRSGNHVQKEEGQSQKANQDAELAGPA